LGEEIKTRVFTGYKGEGKRVHEKKGWGHAEGDEEGGISSGVGYCIGQGALELRRAEERKQGSETCGRKRNPQPRTGKENARKKKYFGTHRGGRGWEE